MKVNKTLHKFISPVLYYSGLYEKLWNARSAKKPFSFVVVYHRVVADNSESSSSFDIERGISARDFENQMKFLVDHFTPVKASQAQTDLTDEIKFSVTLDDGYEDNYLIAAPILKKLGIPATFYVVSDFVSTDRLFWWEQVADIIHKSKRSELDIQAVLSGSIPVSGKSSILALTSDRERDYAYGQLCACIRQGVHINIPSHIKRVAEYFDAPIREEGRKFALMNWQQLLELNNQGFEIGGHTASHCNVVATDKNLLRKEIVGSINIIEDKLGSAVESFAYPYGMYEKSDKMVSEILSRTNCKAAYTIDQGVVENTSPAFELPRTKLNQPYPFACAFNVQDTLINNISI